MKKFFLGILSLVWLIFLGYLLLPNPNFPKPPPDSIQSKEPADTESLFRRAYFTNFTRAEVLTWYQNQITRSTFLNIPLPTYRLNYPPEDAQTLIRDQTRSTFLEEIVHPFREGIYINGFEPKADDQKDAINIEGRRWRQKIIIKFVPSMLFVRILIFFLTTAAGIILFRQWKRFKI